MFKEVLCLMDAISNKIGEFVPAYQRRELLVNELQSFQQVIQNNESVDSVDGGYAYKLHKIENDITEAQNSLSREEKRESVIRKFLMNEPISEEEIILVPELKEEEFPPKSIDKVIEVISSNKEVLNEIVDKLKLEYENVFSVNALSQVEDASQKITDFSQMNELLHHNIDSRRAKSLLS